MRIPKATYCYQHKEFVKKTASAQEAAALADTSVTTVRKIINGDLPSTRDGWVFTDEPLTPEEMKHMPDSWKEKIPLKRINKKTCRKEVRNQEYEVSCSDGLVTHIPRSKEERKQLLRAIVYTKLETRWKLIPETISTLERQTISELINSL